MLGKPKGKKKASGLFGMHAFGGIFAAFGIALSYFSLGAPRLQHRAAQSWTPSTCQVEASRVDSDTDDDGTKYAADISYSYVVDGRRFGGDRHSFGKVYNANKSHAVATVQEYPIGSKVACYYDPSEPGSSVIDRSLQSDGMSGFIGLAFALIGFAVIVQGFRLRRARNNPWRSRSLADGRVELIRRDVDVSELLVVAGFAVGFDTGLIGWIYAAANGVIWAWFALFVWLGVCVFLTGWFVRSFLIWVGPRLRVTVNKAEFHIGEMIQLEWELRGFTAISELRISLVGREEATYTRGTDAITDKEDFHTKRISGSRPGRSHLSGKETVRLPKNTMHSFISEHNRVRWLLLFNADVAWWPDIEESLKST